MEVLIVGGGASGLMAALTAARMGAVVTLLEGMEKPGKKLLTTGNGRCNLTNLSICDSRDYHTGDREEADRILKAFPAETAMEFFQSLGLLLKTRGDLVYPYTDQASTVLDALLEEASRLKIKIKCKERVEFAGKRGKHFFVKTKGWQYEADRLILSTGGRAAPLTGSDGSGYSLAQAFGHTLVPVLPGLVPLAVKETFVKALEGIRSRASMRLYADGNCLGYQEGELQWTSYGISGILVFQLSSLALKHLRQGETVCAEIDLFPDFSMDGLRDRVQRRWALGDGRGFTWETLLGGFYQKKLLSVLLKEKGRKAGQTVEFREALDFLSWTKKLSLNVSGGRGFEQAQVCSGGVPLSEIEPESLESRKVKGLYLTGELLDVDGPCGGYNLQWAWATGCLAGSHGGKGDR